MAGRTYVTGDIHGDLEALLRVTRQLPELDSGDTLVFLGDYVDRGPQSAQVVEYVRTLPTPSSAWRSCGCATSASSATTAASASSSGTPSPKRCPRSCPRTRPKIPATCGPGRAPSGSTPAAARAASSPPSSCRPCACS